MNHPATTAVSLHERATELSRPENGVARTGCCSVSETAWHGRVAPDDDADSVKQKLASIATACKYARNTEYLRTKYEMPPETVSRSACSVSKETAQIAIRTAGNDAAGAVNILAPLAKWDKPTFKTNRNVYSIAENGSSPPFSSGRVKLTRKSAATQIRATKVG